jgi:2-(1,2-epoxy-1,2-dihydrophenyl)acetyl-CoA isomerase
VVSKIIALEAFREDDDAYVLVLTGAGSSVCAGGDLKMLEKRLSEPVRDPLILQVRYRDGVQRIPRTLESIDKPVLAAVNGPAVGAGCDLASMANIRIASEDAHFGEVFGKLGLAPGGGGCYFLTRTVGLEKACELIFTGDVIDAGEAHRIGMVSRVVAPEALPLVPQDGIAYRFLAKDRNL